MYNAYRLLCAALLLLLAIAAACGHQAIAQAKGPGPASKHFVTP